MYTITPKQITKPILKLAKELVPQPRLEYVPIKPEPTSILNECFVNVRKKIVSHGGTIQHGWQFWEWPGIYVEAEFHAVWVAPTGELVDVTHKDHVEDHILFLPDHVRIYQEKSIDNERRALMPDKMVRDLIRSSKEVNRLKTEGEHPGNPNITIVNANELQYWSTIRNTLVKLLASGARQHSPCFCGSGRQYQRCHAL